MSDSINPESVNPYESLQAETGVSNLEDSEDSFASITEDMISSMKQSSSWIRFLAICGFVYAGFIIAAGVLSVSIFIFLGSASSNTIAAELGMDPLLFGIMITILILAVGMLIIVPFRFLYNFGTKMRTYVQTGNESALELAFMNNKSFWKFCGIVTIVLLALVPISLIASLIIVGVLYV